MDLNVVQAALREAQLDGWLFYDHHQRDPIAYRVLKLKPGMCTRRWYYLVPAEGEPIKLVHRVEKAALADLPGTEYQYSSWKEQRERLKEILQGKKTLAMQYSPLNNIPYVGLVDAGTVELIRSLGIEVVSSADLVQQFEARWSGEALALHLKAGEAIHRIIRDAFAKIGDAARNNRQITEYDVQQLILRLFALDELVSSDPPIVAANANTANPHYEPAAARSAPIRPGDFVLLDVWAKCRKPGAVYYDITWTGYVGDEVPARYAQVFAVVREARDAAAEFVRQAMRAGRLVRGYEVDDVARGVISGHGYGEFFVHRTGHSIGEEVHGNGANMDNYETHDERRIIPGTCFSIEPGIYLAEFGVRSEVDVYVEENDARVTGESQKAIVPIPQLSR
jgi:Xaa-Pro aminopeptidase